METALLGLFAIGYFVLAGADLGTGMVMPFIGREPQERRLVITAIGPFFLGSEVWLVATVGLIAGLFPALEAMLLAGLFPVFVALLTGWIVRDMGLWLRSRLDGAAWQRTWDAAVVAGSWTVALSWGAAIGTLWQGLPFRLGMLPILGAAVGAALFALHGAAFAELRLTGVLRERTGRIGRVPFAITAVLMALLPATAVPNLTLEAAPDTGWLAITVLAVTPFLIGAQVWMWRLFSPREQEVSYL